MPIPELTAALEQIEGVRFAVMDGAHFDDLQGRLNAAGLSFEPLFVDDGKRNLQADGPHLVPLKDHGAIKRVADLARGKPAVVWWVWPDEGGETQANLVRHLRSVNMVEIPVDRYDAPQESSADSANAHPRAQRHEEGTDQLARYELVVFRHADPNVLAMILPLLDAAQVSRLFGRAVGIVLDAPDHGGLRTFVRPAQLPDAPKGWLRIRPEQYEMLGAARKVNIARAVHSFLLMHAAQQTQSMSRGELEAFVSNSMNESLSFGVKSEASHCRWAYLQILAGGQLLTLPSLQEALKHPSRTISPDERIRIFMKQVMAQVRVAS